MLLVFKKCEKTSPESIAQSEYNGKAWLGSIGFHFLEDQNENPSSYYIEVFYFISNGFMTILIVSQANRSKLKPNANIIVRLVKMVI